MLVARTVESQLSRNENRAASFGAALSFHFIAYSCSALCATASGILATDMRLRAI